MQSELYLRICAAIAGCRTSQVLACIEQFVCTCSARSFISRHLPSVEVAPQLSANAAGH